MIQFEYLGIGDAQLGFRISGSDQVVHTFLNSNQFDSSYMKTSNLPIRWEMKNNSSIINKTTMDSLCCSIINEGGNSSPGQARSVSNAATGISITTTGQIKQILALRLNSSHVRATINLKKITVMSSTTSNFRYIVSINPIFQSGSSPLWEDIPNTFCQVDKTRNGAILSGSDEGTVISTGYVSRDANVADIDVDSFIRISSDFDGNQDELVVSVQSLAATTETYYASVFWIGSL